MNIDNKKPINNILKYNVVFYEEEAKPNTWGSNDIVYEIYYDTKDGIMQVCEVGAFGDSSLVAMYKDRRGRGITLKEMLENIEEISEMTFKEFKEKILKKWGEQMLTITNYYKVEKDANGQYILLEDKQQNGYRFVEMILERRLGEWR